jgi:signal transduction histidine kinase
MTGLLFLELALSVSFCVVMTERFYPEVFAVLGVSRFYLIYLVFVLCTSIIFFLARLCLHILRIWDHIRRTRLRWTVTHSHLMVVVIGAGLISFVSIFLAVFVVGARNNNQVVLSIFSVIFVLSLILLATVVTIIIVLPPSILSSILFTRRISRRVEDLAAATSALRQGDYSIRIAVDGEDEIARLQTDFNVMASALEETMRELKAERDNVRTLLEARRELIASVSHELRTPVATVRGYLESTLATWRPEHDALPPESMRDDLLTMQQQIVRLQSLINDLFTLARAEVGHLEMRCVPTAVLPIVQGVVNSIAPLAWRSSRIEVLAEVATDEQMTALAVIDEQRLEQILYNLIHNAIRHTQPGGIIVVSGQVEQEQILLQVKDTGEGIAAEELPRIWERFYRGRSSQEQGATGTGLGLAIVKELSEAMGGTVAVESIVGQGTCFSLRFPLVRNSTEQITGRLAIVQHPTAPLRI